MTRRPAAILTALLVCLWARPSSAQEPASPDPPAHISVVDGSAVLERDGRTDADLVSMPLLAGDRVRTDAGRVEVLFADGSTLHLDEHTVVDFQSDEVVRLLGGRIRLSVAGPSRDIAYRIDAPSAWVQINNPGEYRVTLLRGDEVELAVLRGGAELVNEQGRSYVSAGERTYARAQAAPSPAYVFNSAAWDSFDRWSETRRDQRLGVSAQYLPDNVRSYAPALDTYGSWRHEQAYGYVWYPRVQVGWRPYHRGRWVTLRPYGWTWVAGDPWGWPTHHYGRWGLSAGSWFWVPGRSWAPAWVSWAYAPGYVSWCPLGWNDRPVFQFGLNVYGGRRYDPWDAWSILPRHHFTTAYVNVSRYPAVRVDPRLHGSFVINGRGPDVHFAVNRSAVPIRTAGRSTAWRADGERGSGTGSPRLSATPDGARASEGRFPAAARTPGSPIANTPSARTQVRSRDDGRGLPRPVAPAPGSAAAAAPAASESRAISRTEEAPRYRGGSPRGLARSEAAESTNVSEAPAGAVRAMPRTRGAAADAPGAPPVRQVRPYSAVPRYQAPAASAPRNQAPAESAPSPPERGSTAPVPVYEPPQNRGGRGGEERSYSREPSPRGGVERSTGSDAPRPRGDGGGRQAAPPPSERPAGGNNEARPGGGPRERPGGGHSTGQAVGRRR